MPGASIFLSIELPGIVEPQGLLAEGQFVWEVIDGIIAKFKNRFSGIDPDQLRLRKPDGSTSVHLYPMQTLSEAGIRSGTTLVVEVLPVQAPAPPKGRLSICIVAGGQCCGQAYLPVCVSTLVGMIPQMQLPWLIGRAEGITLADPTIIRRAAKCATIFSALDLQPLRLLRSPPASGKTSLAALLATSAPATRVVTAFTALDALDATHAQFEDLWLQWTGMPLKDALDPSTGPFRTFVIDEAQLLFQLGVDSPFWRLLKKINGAPTSRVQVLLLAVYGLRARIHQHATPIEISGSWSLAFLALSDAEVDEFFAAFNSTCTSHGCPPITIAIRAAMQRLCGHHVGLLRRCEILFQDYFKGKTVITPEDEADFNAGPLVMLGSAGELRALPSLLDLSPAEVAVILRVAIAGPGGLTLTGGEISVFPAMLETAGVVDLEPHYNGVVVRFSSPAMRGHALRAIFGNLPRLPLPAAAFATASLLVRAIVVRMMQPELRRSLSIASGGSLLERQYQMSFFA